MVSVARYEGLKPASPRASRAARGASGKRDTRPELHLRSALHVAGARGYRVTVDDLPGRPDVVFRVPRVVVFCDGDFWHGRDLDARIERLERGHNAPYWVKKIRGNVARDRCQEDELRALGWTVMRFWESEIKRDSAAIAASIATVVRERRGVATL